MYLQSYTFLIISSSFFRKAECMGHVDPFWVIFDPISHISLLPLCPISPVPSRWNRECGNRESTAKPTTVSEWMVRTTVQPLPVHNPVFSALPSKSCSGICCASPKTVACNGCASLQLRNTFMPCIAFWYFVLSSTASSASSFQATLIWSALMKSEKIECSSWTFGSVGTGVEPFWHVQHSVCDLDRGPCISKFDFMQDNSGYVHELLIISHLQWGWHVDTWIILNSYETMILPEVLAQSPWGYKNGRLRDLWSHFICPLTSAIFEHVSTHCILHLSCGRSLPVETWKAEPSSSKAGAALFMMFCRRHWDALQTGLSRVVQATCWMRQAGALFALFR